MRKACIIIPCYNEELRLDFGAFENFMQSESDYDFLFVNDGSSDTTLKLITSFSEKYPQRVSALDASPNGGKAEAVRKGIVKVCGGNQYQYVGFWDADLATPLSEIPLLFDLTSGGRKKIVIGSRWKHLGATVERKTSRHFLGRIFSTFASKILRLPVYDTQCGAKMFSSDLVSLFEERFMTKWLFDIEILARYRNKFGLERALLDIVEKPVNEWKEKGGSKLGVSQMIKAPLELFSIHLKYN